MYIYIYTHTHFEYLLGWWTSQTIGSSPACQGFTSTVCPDLRGYERLVAMILRRLGLTRMPSTLAAMLSLFAALRSVGDPIRTPTAAWSMEVARNTNGFVSTSLADKSCGFFHGFVHVLSTCSIFFLQVFFGGVILGAKFMRGSLAPRSRSFRTERPLTGETSDLVEILTGQFGAIQFVPSGKQT